MTLKETPRQGVLARIAQMTLAPSGSVRVCKPYAGELARHRVVSADGQDFVVATYAERAGEAGYVTGAYPVSRGYLVMLRQPLYETRTMADHDAREQHEALIRALAEAGAKVVRARRTLANRRRAEHGETLPEPIALADRRAARALTDSTAALAL